jgi:F-type H+-transporting ATPase subunit delta
VTNRTAAHRYARALFDVALQEGADLERIDGELTTVTELFARYRELQEPLLNPAVPVTRKRAVMVELTQRLQPSPMVAKLLALLADRDRLVLLPDLLASYRERMLDHRHVVRAEVTTAEPIGADGAEAIARRLGQVTGRTIRLQTRVDPAIVGGLVAKVGSTVYDASVTRQLQKLRERLSE